MLLAADASVTAASATGDTPLHVACMFNHLPAISRLLAAGANSDAANHVRVAVSSPSLSLRPARTCYAPRSRLYSAERLWQWQSVAVCPGQTGMCGQLSQTTSRARAKVTACP